MQSSEYRLGFEPAAPLAPVGHTYRCLAFCPVLGRPVVESDSVGYITEEGDLA